MAQLALPLTLADHARFETFVPGPNAAAVERVRRLATGTADAVWLCGPAASGKTHLLQAACRLAAHEGGRAMYVHLGAEHAADPAILAGLETVDVLALDDVAHVAGRASWERALFVLFNEVRDRGGGLLLAARAAAGASEFRLPDLATRLASVLSYRLDALDDDALLRALLTHAEARGLELEPAAGEYLLHRVVRDMGVLRDWVDRLDRASLTEQRRLTIPFIRRLLAAEAESGE